MICSNCYKSFDGIGSYCPACRPHASAQTAQANFNSAGLQNESDRGIYPAGMVGRIVAFIFDSLLLALIINVILVPFFAGFIVEYLTKGILDAFSGGSKNAIIFLMASILISTFSVVILIALFSPLYYILFESSALQGTPGKLLVGLKVTNMQSERLSITRAFLRLIARWIGVVPLILLLFLAPIAAYFQVPSLVLLAFSLFFLSPIIFLMTYPLAFFTHYKQGLHDLISSCVVQEKEEGAPQNGFLLAVIGIIVFFVLIYFFAPAETFNQRHRNEHNKQNFIDLQYKLQIKKPPLSKNPPLVDLDSTNTKIIPEIKKSEELPLLSEGMSASVGQKVLEFKKVKALLGATRRIITLDFYSEPQNQQADLRIALHFRWPVSTSCSLKELDRYELIFRSNNSAGSFELPNNMKNFILSRYGSPPGEEILGLNCNLRGNNMDIKVVSIGQSASKPDEIAFQWNISASTSLSLID